MSDAEPPRETKLLPDAIHQAETWNRPAAAGDDTCRAAMARAVSTDNATAAQILIDTSTGRTRPIATEAPQTGRKRRDMR
ncbi:hypothetical protein LRS74_24855 [Streptomyces sp. LX-29]|uniref:hypothetical protein n=1 Tax=Streptomyces sp. LX-29 TaxID=2900152 RepID=UPI00240E280A|nr:hypothetical protein [Streptomyces sp. LX-29]WFB09909.1 hypothetical protein LRS74_24855 [Streptomyces sp. LX-29]